MGCIGAYFSEGIIVSEVHICVKEHLDVVMEVFPCYLARIPQVFAINTYELRQSVLRLSVSISSLIDNSDLFASHVGALSFVGLDSPSLLCFTKHARDARQAVYCGVTDPSDVRQPIVHHGEWIDDHPSARIFAVADHDESRLYMRVWLMDRLLVDEHLKVVGAEVALASLPNSGNLVALRATAALQRDSRVGNLCRHGQRRINHHVAAVVEAIVPRRQSLLTLMVHQHANSVNLDALALYDVVESLV